MSTAALSVLFELMQLCGVCYTCALYCVCAAVLCKSLCYVYCFAVYTAIYCVQSWILSAVVLCVQLCCMQFCIVCSVYRSAVCVLTAAVLGVLFNTMHLCGLLCALHSVCAVSTDQCAVYHMPTDCCTVWSV